MHVWNSSTSIAASLPNTSRDYEEDTAYLRPGFEGRHDGHLLLKRWLSSGHSPWSIHNGCRRNVADASNSYQRYLGVLHINEDEVLACERSAMHTHHGKGIDGVSSDNSLFIYFISQYGRKSTPTTGIWHKDYIPNSPAIPWYLIPLCTLT